MALYKIKHNAADFVLNRGQIFASGEGEVELSDKDVEALVKLIKTEKSTDIEELHLKEKLPEVFEKLDQAFLELAYDTQYRHGLLYGYYSGFYDFEPKDVLKHCEEKLGFKFDGRLEDYIAEFGEWLGERRYEGAKLRALDAWLENYLEGLPTVDLVTFFDTVIICDFNACMDDTEYDVEIPQEIIELAKKQ